MVARIDANYQRRLLQEVAAAEFVSEAGCHAYFAKRSG